MTVAKVFYSGEELLEWYRTAHDDLMKSMSGVIERIESMDRSLLVAECARVHANLIHTRQVNSSLRLTLNSMVPTKEGQ